MPTLFVKPPPTCARRDESPRIFSGATNVSFLRGILKAGFQYRFSFFRRTKLGRSIIARRETTTVIAARQL
ncbi:MAG: hypothetical protein WAN41_20465 [Candidatus Sulfotelmatobacter sp.]